MPWSVIGVVAYGRTMLVNTPRRAPSTAMVRPSASTAPLLAA